MLSGLKNIHPTYCQSLTEGTRYTMPQMSMILDRIPHEHRAIFNRNVFNSAVASVLEASQAAGPEQALDDYKPGKMSAAIVAAGGPSLAGHVKGLQTLASRDGFSLIECNDTGALESISDRLVVILNKIKLTAYLHAKGKEHPQVITGESRIDAELQKRRVSHLAYELGPFAVSEKIVTIPDYDAGMFAIGIAILSGARRIFLAGFDGFEDPARNVAMENFFSAVRESHSGIDLITLTPSRYQHVAHSSVYAALATTDAK
jgi:4-hydroxy 2-oxovalerate aldolase